MRIEEYLNVTFDESFLEPKSSPSVEDDRIIEPIVQNPVRSPPLEANASELGYPKSVKEARGNPIEQERRLIGGWRGVSEEVVDWEGVLGGGGSISVGAGGIWVFHLDLVGWAAFSDGSAGDMGVGLVVCYVMGRLFVGGG
ncbi:hypothetical protein Tco_0714960 [Tanacetum coccineum]